MNYTKAGITRIDLFEDGLYCDILVTDGEVVYEIKDGFESSKQHYENVFIKSSHLLDTVREKLEVGKQYKYKDLCEVFGFDHKKTGNTKKKYLATFDRYMKLEKNKTWYTVTEIYDKVKD